MFTLLKKSAIGKMFTKVMGILLNFKVGKVSLGGESCSTLQRWRHGHAK